MCVNKNINKWESLHTKKKKNKNCNPSLRLYLQAMDSTVNTSLFCSAMSQMPTRESSKSRHVMHLFVDKSRLVQNKEFIPEMSLVWRKTIPIPWITTIHWGHYREKEHPLALGGEKENTLWDKLKSRVSL